MQKALILCTMVERLNVASRQRVNRGIHECDGKEKKERADTEAEPSRQRVG